MIKTVSLTKTFGPTTALENLSTTIESGSIYGLVGSNGAGKSTLLHLLAGIYRPTSGSIEIDGQPVYENSACKQQIFFIPDEIYQQPGASMESMAKLYACLYTQWSQQRYEQLVQRFPIDPKRKLSTCSKGMRRQIAIILGMSCMPKYLLLDEAFDGLDPVIRVAVRKLISDDVIERGITVLIASHNLRELEDLCDQVGSAARRTHPVPTGAGPAALRLCQNPVCRPSAALPRTACSIVPHHLHAQQRQHCRDGGPRQSDTDSAEAVGLSPAAV